MFADNLKVPAGNFPLLWDDLVEASIAYELAQWDSLRDP
jgi:hypothetical protein